MSDANHQHDQQHGHDQEHGQEHDGDREQGHAGAGQGVGAMNDRQHEQGYRRAFYQGEHVGLRLNAHAAAELRDALDRIGRGWGWCDRAEVRLRLPDGRDLTLSVTAVDDGTVRDADGEYLGDDGTAHGDVTGDLDLHRHAQRLIDAVTRISLLELPVAGDDQEIDVGWLEARDRQVIDRLLDQLPSWHTPVGETWRGQLRERAEGAAAATRAERLAEAQRMARQLAEGRAQRQAQPVSRPDRGATARLERADGGASPSAGLGMGV